MNSLSFRFNRRKAKDGERFVRALALTKGHAADVCGLTRKPPQAN